MISLVSSGLAVIGILCLWALLQLLVFGGTSEARAQHLLYGQFRSEVAQATAPTGILDYAGKQIQPGAPVATMSIPEIGLFQTVVSGASGSDLRDGPGHWPTTVLPGQSGISVVLGRSTTYGAPFRHIGDLTPGATITVQNAQGKVVYTVLDVRHTGDPIPAAPTGEQGRLILVTSAGNGFLSGLRPSDVVYVDATAKKALPAGAVAPGPLPDEQQPMGRDTSVLPVLVMLLALLVGATLAVSALSRRFRPALVWTLAAPCVLALAWAVTSEAVRLLPNVV